MFDGGRGLKPYLAGQYLQASTELTHRLLRGRSGQRDFQRVVIVAALGRNNGIASGARLQWKALQQLGVDVELLDAAPALRNPLVRIPHRPGTAYVFHSGGPQTACLIRSVLPHAADAYRVAYWAWELPDPPEDWNGCDRNVSEIWTPSSYARASLSRIVSKPVDVVPHYLSAFPARKRGQNGPFTVLAMADSRSSFSRKNPVGALEAFRMAFGTSKAARLLLKITGTADRLDALIKSFGDLSGLNVEIIKGFLTPPALAALYREADVLLSLHRAEGFGLPMLEAMAHGVPVIATGWSGNLEFMDPSDSCLVSYRLIPVDDASAVYGGSVWADPDLSSAAKALRDLAAEPCEYARLAAAAHRRVDRTPPRFPFALPGCTSPVPVGGLA
jgi:glycosyltransferase involved in cell wall biosynthesis